jgi:hypothetical protein
MAQEKNAPTTKASSQQVQPKGVNVFSHPMVNSKSLPSGKFNGNASESNGTV